MPGKGPAPKPANQRHGHHSTPLRGEYRSVPGTGWQHGAIPDPPPDMDPPTLAAWNAWLRGWFAAHWTPADLPGLLMVAKLYNSVGRGDYTRMTELRLSMDAYGISPKGQQDRRWLPPGTPAAPGSRDIDPSAYSHLRPLPGGIADPLDEYLAAQAERRTKREAAKPRKV